MWRGDGDKSADGVNAAAKGETVNESRCTMSSWKSQCVGKSMLLDGYVVRAQEWLLWSRGAYGANARRTRQCALNISYTISTDGEKEE